MRAEECPCGSGKPFKKCCYENQKKTLEVFQALKDMDLPTTTGITKYLEGVKGENYPTFHNRVLESAKKGKLEILEIYEYYKDLGFKDIRGERYWTIYEFTPLEKRPFFTFELDNLKFALPSPFVARSLDERLAVLDVKDETEFYERLKTVKNPSLSVEGYTMKDYTIMVPLSAIRSLDNFLQKTQKITLKDGAKGYILYISDSEHRVFPRTLPSPRFSFSEALGIYTVVLIEGNYFLTSYSQSWARAEANYQNLKRWVISEKYIIYHSGENEPKEANYTEIAEFYSRIDEYEVGGKALGRWREEDEKFYLEVIKTFAFVEAQLSKWRAISYPYKNLLRYDQGS